MFKVGEKGKYCYLKLPTPSKENVIIYPQFLPKELDLHEYVDYKTQFEKSFKSTLRDVTEKIGWDIDNTVTLEAFFS